MNLLRAVLSQPLRLTNVRKYLSTYSTTDAQGRAGGPAVLGTVRAVFEANEWDYQYHLQSNDPRTVPLWVRWGMAWGDVVRGAALALACDLVGHGELLDVGCHAGPDTASDHYQCARCGRAFDHTYY